MRLSRGTWIHGIAFAILACAAPLVLAKPDARSCAGGERTRYAASRDGVSVAYCAYGDGAPALVFIHGGFADREFWKHQIDEFAAQHRVVTLDLAGHGESGTERESWSIDAFGADVVAVIEALELDRVVLVGNSLGGPVGLAVARQMPRVVVGLVVVDTFQDVDLPWPREQRLAYVEALERDFDKVCDGMMGQLFLEGAASDLVAWVRGKMCGFDPAIAPHVVSDFVDYDPTAAFAAASVPIRAIQGETVELDVAGNRELQPTFDAVTMKGCGHYPMLERPEEFNRHLRAYVDEIITMETTMTQKNNDRRIDYIEFRTTAMAETKRFYSAVFGWEFTDYGPNYSSFEDGRLAGGFEVSEQVVTGGTLVVIYAEKLEEIEATVRAHGGQVVQDIFEFPGGRRFHFTDPSGNELAVWSDR